MKMRDNQVRDFDSRKTRLLAPPPEDPPRRKGRKDIDLTTRLIGISAAYWLAALLLLGLATILHGHCSGADDIMQRCIDEKRRISMWGLMLAALLYFAILFRAVRRGV